MKTVPRVDPGVKLGAATKMAELDCDVIVIGAGISGLVVAAELAQQGGRVTVLESSAAVGGKIKSCHDSSGYLTESAASLLLNFRPDVQQFIERHNLDRHKVAKSSYSDQNRYLANNQQLFPVPISIGKLFSSSFWSWQTKLRLMVEPFIPKGGTEHESVSEFVRRRMGSDVLEKAMEPFVGGTLAGDPDSANAWSTLPRLTALEQKYGSITAGVIINKLLRRRSAMINDSFSFYHGMASLPQRLAQTEGITLKTRCRASQLQPHADGWQLEIESHNSAHPKTEIIRSRKVIIATPAAAAASLVEQLNSDLATALQQINYAPLAVVHTGFRREKIHHPLDGTGFLIPRRERRFINGNLWMSSLFERRAPAEQVLLTSYVGGARSPEKFALSDETLVQRCSDDINHFTHSHATPEWYKIDRHQQALPLYQQEHLQLMRHLSRAESQLGGLHLLGNYRGGVSIRDRVVQGTALANAISKELHLHSEQAGNPVPVSHSSLIHSS